MSDADQTYRFRLVAETTEHDRDVERSAGTWETSSRRMSRSAREAGQTTTSESRRSSSSWEAAAQRMTSASSRVAREATTSGRRAGSSWSAAAGQIQAAATRTTSGLAGAGGALSNFASRAVAAGGGAKKITTTLGPLIVKLFAIVGAAGAAGSALAAIPAAAGALGGMAAVVGFAFSGVGKALKGYQADQDAAAKASKSGGGAAASSARAIRDAYKGIDNANRSAARTARDGDEQVEAASERVQDAKKAEARSYRDVEDAIKDQARVARESADSIAAADKRYTSAQKDVQRSEVDLDTARKEALHTMEELQERVSDLALDQEGASIALAEAEQAYYREMRSSQSTELSRRKALYDLNVAKERQSDLERENTEAVAANNDAQTKGVEGSDQVVAAKERLAEAQDAEAEAAKDAARAREDADDANAAAARRVSDAQDAAADSTHDREKAELELQRTQRATQEANEDAARAVADAVQGLADAQAEAGASAASGAAGQDQFGEAMKKLGPEGQAFVRKLIEMKKYVEDLKKSVAAKFLPGMTQMLEDSKSLFPVFERGLGNIGTAMSGVALKFGGLFKSSEFQANLEQMLNNAVPILTKLGDGAVKLVDAFVRLGANKEISDGLGHLVDGILTGLVGLLDKLNANGSTFGENLSKWGDFIGKVLPLAGDLLAWAASIDPSIVGVGTAIGGLLLLGGKFAPFISAATRLFKAIGKDADDNGGKVDNFRSKLRKLMGGGSDDDGGGGGGGSGGGGGGKTKTTGKTSKKTKTKNAAKTGGRAITGLLGDDGGGGMEIAGGLLDGFENGGDGDLWTGDGMADDIGGWIAGLTGQLDTLGPKIDGAKAKVGEFVPSAAATLGQLPGKAGGWFGGLWSNAKQWLGLTGTDTAAGAKQTLAGVDGGLSGLPGSGSTWFGRLLDSATAKGAGLLGWARGLPGSLLGSIGNLGTLLWGAGSDLVQGMWRGIEAGWKWLGEMVGWLAGNLLTAAKNALGIRSPSRKARDQVGRQVPAGVGEGIIADAKLATDRARDLGRGVVDAARGEVHGTSMAMGLGLSGLPRATALGGGAPQPAAQVVHETHVHVAGTVVAERELMDLVRTQSTKYARRNTSNGLGG